MLNPALLWLIAGAVLCLMELAFPTAFVAFMMGISAIIVSIVALINPPISLQLVLWLILSTASVFLSRRWLTPKQKGSLLREAHEGETLTEILPNQSGRVLYEGNSWRAVCADDHITIAAHQPVYIVKQKGTTLIVLPRDFPLFPLD